MERNSCGSVEPLPESLDSLSDLAGGGHQTYEWFQPHIQAVEDARTRGSATFSVSVQNSIGMLNQSAVWIDTSGTIEVVEHRILSIRTQFVDGPIVHTPTLICRAVEVAIRCLYETGVRISTVGRAIEVVQN